MKKILFMLTAAMLTLTACQQRESFDFLLGETNVGLTFSYDQLTYDTKTVETQFSQIKTTHQDALEIAFLEEVNDELEEVLMRAYRMPSSAQINYVFEISPTKVTEYGIREATVRVYDKDNNQKNSFTLSARNELDQSFMERISDSMEELGEQLGKNIRYGM